MKRGTGLQTCSILNHYLEQVWRPVPREMIITIDGPAGAGKSTVARALAERLGYRYLDTGAMYRAVTLAALQANLSADDADKIAELASRINIVLCEDRVLLDGVDVTAAIRTPEVTQLIHIAADNPAVRDHLVELQRCEAASGDIVCEGRDQGTVAFPDADVKFFVTATPAERARRRQEDLRERGVELTLQQILADQTDRDQRDAERPVGSLRKADDAVEVLTDGLTVEQVVAKLEAMVRGTTY